VKFDNTDIYVTPVGSTDVRRVTTNPAEDFAAFDTRNARSRSAISLAIARRAGRRIPRRGGVGASCRSRSPTGISRCYSRLFKDNRPQKGLVRAVERGKG